MGTATVDTSFRRCVSLLRRGVVSGGDITELLESLEGVTECVGLSLSAGYGLGPDELLRKIDPDWPRDYLPHASTDPAPGYLASAGPFSVYSVSKHAPAETWNAPLGRAFARAGFVDAAITCVGGLSGAVIAAYRPRGLAPFSDTSLDRIGTLLPLLELAFAPGIAHEAMTAPRDESTESALRRIGTYAILDLQGGEIVYSPAALRLFHELFEGFGPRGERRIERALRLAHARLLARKGTRVVRLRTDLTAELSLLPKRGGDSALLVTFTRRAPPDDDTLVPCDELLSPTQRIVARRIARGATIPAVARDLKVSPDAVKAHLREVYRRLGVTSRPELASLYVAK